VPGPRGPGSGVGAADPLRVVGLALAILGLATVGSVVLILGAAVLVSSFTA
jgi:hypothetical protein